MDLMLADKSSSTILAISEIGSVIVKFLTSDSSKDGVVSADAGTMLIVLLLGMADVVELGSGSQHATTEPHSVTLHVVSDDSDLEGLGLEVSTAQLLADLNTLVDSALDISLKSSAKVTEHSGTTRKYDVLVQRTTSIDGAVLDGLIYNLGKRCQEIAAGNLRVEEDLRTQESLVSDIAGERTLGDRLHTFVQLDALVRLGVKLGELLDHVRADVAVGFLDSLGNLKGLSGRNSSTLTLSHELLNEAGDITTSNGDVLDATTNDVTISHRDDVGDTITRIDDGSGQGSLCDLLGSPRSGQRKNSLHSDVETGYIEGLEHDLCGVLSVLGSVERRLSQKEMVVLRLTAQVLEDALLPELFHVGPVLNLTMLDGIFGGVGFRVSHSFVTDEEVQVVDGVLGSLGSRATSSRAKVLASARLGIFLDSDHTGDDVVWLAVASEAHLGVTCSIVNNRGRESVSAHVPGVRRE